jgi:hypothetical protein
MMVIQNREVRLWLGALLWIILIPTIYVTTWKYALNWSGKWSGPYYYAVGLSILLAFGALGQKWGQIWWVIPVACIGGLSAWFFNVGIYQTALREIIVHEFRWYYVNYWPEKIPVVIILGATATFLSRGGPSKTRQLYPCIAVFTALLFSFCMTQNWCAKRIYSKRGFSSMAITTYLGFESDCIF